MKDGKEIVVNAWRHQVSLDVPVVLEEVAYIRFENGTQIPVTQEIVQGQ